MYQEEREILLLQREKYKLKIIENLLETRSKVVSKKGALTIGGTAIATFFAYKGLSWFAEKAKKKSQKEAKPEEEISTKSASSPSSSFWGSEFLEQLKEQAILMLMDLAKEQLQELVTRKKK